jgi:pimeloyl-ACP methyl ester carboxylesterase
MNGKGYSLTLTTINLLTNRAVYQYKSPPLSQHCGPKHGLRSTWTERFGERAVREGNPGTRGLRFAQRNRARLRSHQANQAGVLDIGYYEAGPTDGLPVLLLHGFPLFIDSYVEVAPMLAARGCRVIVPYLRGHGSTRFPDRGTPRSGQQGAIGADVIALMMPCG